jgi:N-formylglutamate deformylase
VVFFAPTASLEVMPQKPTRPNRVDETLADLFARPFHIHAPARQTLPFIFASPHSGRIYPPVFAAASRLGATALRRSEDAYVDELFCDVVALGAPLISARFPRAFVDANRGPGELDIAMFDGPLELCVDPPGARVAAGLGVIPRIVRDGAEIYGGKLAAAEAVARIERLYRPYHSALAQLVDQTMSRFGVAVVVDCHSMPSAAAIPDMVLGDRYGASAAGALIRWTQEAFAQSGFSIARNAPYAGGHTTIAYGQRMRGCHAIQIEINRTLYLDEERIERRPHFKDVQIRLTRALTRLTAIDPVWLRPGAEPAQAAE